jgi:transglutaminase-like putative cysteine protease
MSRQELTVTRTQTREGKLSFFLLVLMLLSITWSIELAGWVEGLYVVEWSALCGLFLGFLMTRLGWPRAVSHLTSILLGALVAVAVVGRFSAPSVGWRDGIGVVAYHFDGWLRVLVSARSSADSVTFVLLMTIVGWWIGYVCAWMVFGAHHVWQALALSGGAMLLVAYGSPPEVAPFFVLFIFCALLLVVRVYVYTQEESWERRSARYDRDMTLHFLRDGGLLVLALVLIVWVVPQMSSSSALSDLWLSMEGPWRAAGDEWNRLFSGVLGYSRSYENVPFGQRLALGGPVDLGEEIVMWVGTEGARYWRGMVYDRYTGRGWESTDDETVVVPAGRDLPREDQYEMRKLVEQTVVPNRAGVAQVFQAGQPLNISLPTEIRYRLMDAGVNGTDDPWSGSASISLVKTRVPVSVDRPYVVFSSTSVADVANLREAGDVYPEWVERYLQLPPTLPQRVKDLAEWIASPYENSYDKSVAIRDFLRRTIAYRKDVEAPPEERDSIDYLLFDSQAGYCNYYASAMVVMVRSVGVPARLAVGYAGGELDDDIGWYAVRQRDTHAWVEVYFPAYGWVEFEPTATEATIVRREGGPDEAPEVRGGGTDSQLDRDLERLRGEEQTVLGGGPLPAFTSGRSGSPWLAFLGVAVCGGLGVGAYWYSRRGKAGPASEIGRIYRRMCRYARLAGVTGHVHHTPHEYASLVAEGLPGSAPQVGRIADLFVRDQFAQRPVSVADEQAAKQAWGILRPSMFRALLRRLPELVRSSVRRP